MNPTLAQAFHNARASLDAAEARSFRLYFYPPIPTPKEAEPTEAA